MACPCFGVFGLDATVDNAFGSGFVGLDVGCEFFVPQFFQFWTSAPFCALIQRASSSASVAEDLPAFMNLDSVRTVSLLCGNRICLER